MGVRFAGWIIWAVLVLMVLIVHVRMSVLHGLMDVLVLMMLGEMQPDADAHQQARGKQLEGQGLAEKHHGHDRADEGAVEK